jgi:hypothetical protein
LLGGFSDLLLEGVLIQKSGSNGGQSQEDKTNNLEAKSSVFDLAARIQPFVLTLDPRHLCGYMSQ